MKALLTIAAAASLSACLYPGTTTPRTYEPDRTTASASGPVALGHSQRVGDLVVTPYTVTEDSRCPSGVQCVWAGTVKVATRIDGPGFKESIELELGKPFDLRGHSVRLASVQPTKTDTAAIDKDRYRLTFSR